MLHSGCPQLLLTFRCSVSVGVMLHVTIHRSRAEQGNQPSLQSALCKSRLPNTTADIEPLQTAPESVRSLSRVYLLHTLQSQYRRRVSGKSPCSHSSVRRSGNPVIPLSLSALDVESQNQTLIFSGTAYFLRSYDVMINPTGGPVYYSSGFGHALIGGENPEDQRGGITGILG